MRKIKLIALLILPIFCSGQQFEPGQTIPLPDSLVALNFEVTDFDNDGVLDFLVLAEDDDMKNHFVFIKGDTVDVPQTVSTYYADSVRSYAIYDHNQDTQPDVVVSNGNTAEVFLLKNKGQFVFEEFQLTFPAFDVVVFGDLNNDLVSECILSDTRAVSTTIYKRANDNEWVLVTDSIEVALADFKVFDFDRNGVNDFFLSGVRADGSRTSRLYLNDDEGFDLVASVNDAGISSIGDVDIDGLFEIHLVSENPANPDHYIIARDSVRSVEFTSAAQSLLIADVSNDGLPDQSFYAHNETDTSGVITFKDSATMNIVVPGLIQQVLADVNNDGSLDIVQLIDRGENLEMLWSRNTHRTNDEPSVPSYSVAVEIFDRTFLYWNVSSDDHTIANAITYDVFVADGNDTTTTNFDPATGYRWRAAYGDNGAANFKIIDKTFSSLQYKIQAVDNALFGSKNSICEGNGFSCVSRVDHEETFCLNEQLTLQAPAQNALWFSFDSDYLAEGETLTYSPEAGDVVFYFIPLETGCSLLGTFTFKLNEDTIKNAPDSLYMCETTSREFSTNANATDISWWSAAYGDLGSDPVLNYQSGVDDTLSLWFRNSNGCKEERIFRIFISLPPLNVSPASASVMQGESVQLNVSGAVSYVWNPSTFLNDHQSSSPIATPAEDITYEVTGTDTIGCRNTATVLITVEKSGFVPTLFSPNADGQNDRLLVYGLTSTREFNFSIFNREGERVYSAMEYAEAQYSGWDGTYGGRLQPEGVYYWKIDGSHLSGRRIFLNGKLEGAIVLIR